MKSNLLKESLIIIFLLILSIPATLDLFKPGGFTSHDLTHHVIRQISIDKLITEGSFPPRWSGELNHEYGYPVFIFNYPLPPLLGEVIHKLGWGYVDSVKGVLLISFLISPIGMYLFLRSLTENRTAAFVGAMFYLYAPVRFLNVYVSAALGNALALGIVPYLFWSTTELVKSGKLKWSLLSGVFLALLIMTHNVSTVLFLPVLIVYWFVLNLNTQKIGKVPLTTNYRLLATALFLGFGLSAWFWLPSVVEKQYIRYDQFMAGFYETRFVPIEKVIYSTWGYGSDFSSQVGLIHWLILVPSFWLLVTSLRRKNWQQFSLVLFCWIVFWGGVFMMTSESKFVWQSISFIQYVQFPARFLVLPVFASSIAAGLLLTKIPRKYQLFALIALTILVVVENRNHWHINESTYFTEAEYRQTKTTSTAYDEHLPIWAKPMMVDATAKFETRDKRLEITHPPFGSRELENKSESQSVEIDGEGGEVRLNQFYFPGWQILIDGKETKFDYLKDGMDHGLPVFQVPQGKHLIEAKFTETPLRKTADLISLVSVVILFGFLVASLAKIRFNRVSE